MLLTLAVLFYKERPCSVEFINTIELRIYIAMVIINMASVLCYFLGMMITAIVTGIVLFLYILYSCIGMNSKVAGEQVVAEVREASQANTLVGDKWKKQQRFKIALE